MPHSTLYDFSDTYILVSGTITVVGAGADEAAKAVDREINKKYLKLCTVYRLHNWNK